MKKKANRIYKGVLKNISYHALYTAYRYLLSNTTNKELYIVKYLLLGFQIGNKLDHLLTDETVLKLEKTSRNVFLANFIGCVD